MHRRVWFLVAMAAAVFGLAGSAAAMTAAGSSSNASNLHAAPFAKAWAAVPRTPAARAAKKTMVFGLEQTVTGFNILDADENAYYAAIVAGFPIVRGLYIIDQKGNYHLDLASKVKITKKYLKIWIRPNANWYWVGHKAVPVTASDFIYTWQQLVLAGNNPANTAGYVNIQRAKANSKKVVTFYWKKGQAFADYRDLFPTVLPGFALKGQQFNDYWHNCVCGNDGHPISDGPFYMSNYTAGQGMTVKKNPHWYGPKAKLNEIAFKIITDTNSEIQAMRGGEVDAINPSPESALSTLVHQSNLHYSYIPSLSQEHWDIEVGPQGNPLLKKQWMRAAIAEGLNRQSLIKALYGPIAPGLKPLNNPEWELGADASGKYAYFKKFNFNPKNAIKLLKSHGCTGGPASPSNGNNKLWSCGGQKTEFHFDTTVRASREESGSIFKQELLSIGIKIDDSYHDPATFFGTLLPSANFDLAEYGWAFGSPDPSNWDSIYQCYNAPKNLGGSNYKRYCNKKVDTLMKKGDSNLNSATRTAQYEQAAKLMSNQIAVIPLYASPSIFVYKKALQGAAQSNNATNEGPTWNIQAWHWG
ncbi:MAG TPA: ABC transporter substrate-binding protein [Gaiellaceae bacterium]|nr:ABC transporter substrate-binding protein [Gaiellaceae bacterium]